MPRRKTVEERIEQAKIAHHNENYDYSLWYGLKEISAFTEVPIICPNHGEFRQTINNHNNKKHGCHECAGNQKLTDDDIDIFLRENNIPIKRVNGYINDDTPNQWECLECKCIWPAKPSNIKRSIKTGNNGCPDCAGKNLTNETIDKDLLENNRKIKRIGTYIDAHTKIDWKCDVCKNIWPQKPSHIRSGVGCPRCVNKNEKLAGEVLRRLNLNPVHHPNFITINGVNKNFPVKNIRPIIPDYLIYLPDKQTMIIEINGLQHYESSLYGKQALKDQRKRDRKLKRFCEKNGIGLVEIDLRKYSGLTLVKHIEDLFETYILKLSA